MGAAQIQKTMKTKNIKWQQTLYEVAAYLTHTSEMKGSMAYDAAIAGGRTSLWELAATLADQFEATDKDPDYDYFDRVDAFLGGKEAEHSEGQINYTMIRGENETALHEEIERLRGIITDLSKPRRYILAIWAGVDQSISGPFEAEEEMMGRAYQIWDSDRRSMEMYAITLTKEKLAIEHLEDYDLEEWGEEE